MKKILTLLLLSALTLLADFKAIDPDTLFKMQKEGVPVVDIRTPAEWHQTGIIPGSKTITFFDSRGRYDVPAFLTSLKKAGITKKSPFILVCRSASRTRTVGSFLANQAGYEHVYHLEGGILRWMADGRPLQPYIGR